MTENKPKSPLVAWVETHWTGESYHDIQEYGTAIVYATNERRAEIKAARWHGWHPLMESVHGVKRAPEFDCDSPGPVQAETLLGKGWSMTCFGCEKRVEDGMDYDYDTDEEFDEPSNTDGPIYDGEFVYCCSRCKADYEAEHKARKEARLARETAK